MPPIDQHQGINETCLNVVLSLGQDGVECLHELACTSACRGPAALSAHTSLHRDTSRGSHGPIMMLASWCTACACLQLAAQSDLNASTASPTKHSCSPMHAGISNKLNDNFRMEFLIVDNSLLMLGLWLWVMGWCASSASIRYTWEATQKAHLQFLCIRCHSLLCQCVCWCVCWQTMA